VVLEVLEDALGREWGVSVALMTWLQTAQNGLLSARIRQSNCGRYAPQW
jgi:hypothetical protein